jgi:hypothetical protein
MFEQGGEKVFRDAMTEKIEAYAEQKGFDLSGMQTFEKVYMRFDPETGDFRSCRVEDAGFVRLRVERQATRR